MKYKLSVLKKFHDKYTHELRVVGDVMIVNEARANELLRDKRGLVELVEKIGEEQKPKRKTKAKE